MLYRISYHHQSAEAKSDTATTPPQAWVVMPRVYSRVFPELSPDNIVSNGQSIVLDRKRLSLFTFICYTSSGSEGVLLNLFHPSVTVSPRCVCKQGLPI